MSGELHIWEAAKKALINLGGKGNVTEIFNEIVSRGLFNFGTRDPSDAPHVLETEIKRKCVNSNRSDKNGELIFAFQDGSYWIHEDLDMGQKKASGTKRVHRARDKEDIINLLMREELGVFREIWRLLLFAAQIGSEAGRREPLASIDSGKGIDQSTFGNSPSWPGICFLMALAERGNSEALSGSAEAEDLRLTVFQEYANGGLSILRDFFRDRTVNMEALLSFIEGRTQQPVQEADLNLSI